MLRNALMLCADGNIIMGGDWNCTENFTIDRTSEEPHLQSASQLSKIIREIDLLDMWRIKHPQVRQYTWIKMTDNRVQCCSIG